MGHGAEYITNEAHGLPEHVQLFRMVDTKMAERMANWCLWAILNCQVCAAGLAVNVAAASSGHVMVLCDCWGTDSS